MKKFIAILMAAVVAFTAVDCAYASPLRREQRKEYKKKMKEFKKGGWQIANSSRTIEVALLMHYEKLNNMEDGQEIIGNAKGISDNVLQQVALNNACNYYARKAGSVVRGRIASDLANDGSAKAGEGEFDRMYAAYETAVEKELRGELVPTFSIVRKVGKNKDKQEIKEYRTFFIVDEDAASRARIRAWEQAKKESEVAQRYANQVSNFVQEAFKVD